MECRLPSDFDPSVDLSCSATLRLTFLCFSETSQQILGVSLRMNYKIMNYNPLVPSSGQWVYDQIPAKLNDIPISCAA